MGQWGFIPNHSEILHSRNHFDMEPQKAATFNNQSNCQEPTILILGQIDVTASRIETETGKLPSAKQTGVA
jgi:hypothetical protein